jgi:hypothetical protein
VEGCVHSGGSGGQDGGLDGEHDDREPVAFHGAEVVSATCGASVCRVCYRANPGRAADRACERPAAPRLAIFAGLSDFVQTIVRAEV